MHANKCEENMAVVEYELAEDTKELLAKNGDATCQTPELAKKINDANDFVLLKVTKTINSPITIIAAEEMTEELIKSL